MTATTDHAIRHAIPKLLAIADALAPEGHGTAGEYGDCPGCDLRAVVADLRDALDGETPSEAPDAGSGPSPEGRSGRNSGVSGDAGLPNRAVKYKFGGHPLDAADFYVENRSGLHGDLWAVTQRGQCMERSGEWQWEPNPSSRDEDYFAMARYDRDTALAIAGAIERARGIRRVVNLPESEWQALQALDKAAVMSVLKETK